MARPVQSRSVGEYSPVHALKVSTQEVEILFGRTRTAVLREGDIMLATGRPREYKSAQHRPKTCAIGARKCRMSLVQTR